MSWWLAKLVVSKNNMFFCFLVLGYLFGVILYDFIGFDYTDELMAVFLLVFAAATVRERHSMRQMAPLYLLFAIFLFYTIYSFAIGSNVPQAILKDLIIQIKPYLGLFCTMIIAPRLSYSQKRFITMMCIVVGCVITIVWLSDSVWEFFGHPSRLATAAAATALLFLWCTSFSKTDLAVFAVLLCVGLLSTRSKYYGFCGVAMSLTLYVKLGGNIRLNVKTILLAVVVILIAVGLSWQKIVLYYIDGAMNSREMWSRPAMMLTSLRILADYMPFGCGLGSFGTFASAEYYSSIYEKYGLSHMWGLSKDMPDFITDAFYPELAQFGIVGVLLYIAFWWWVVHRAVSMNLSHANLLLSILVFAFFLIEGVADSTFTHNRGLFVLILLGCVISDNDRENEVEKRYI
jgi:hypothetical protein